MALLPMPPAAASETAFPIRMVKLVGAVGDPKTDDHVRFCRSIGFNALWVYGYEAGRWSESARIAPAFKKFARAARADGLDLWISVNPVGDTGERFVFDDPGGEERIVRFARALVKTAGISNFVLSFDDQPTELYELRDVLRYGRSAAPAHLDLVRRVAARLPAGVRLWFCASAYSDVHLGDGQGPYAKPFLAGLSSLPPSVGMVWTGPTVVSPSITRRDVEATRERLGGREILLYDNFPMNDYVDGDALALALGPLRHRSPDLGAAVHAYLACPMDELGGSRASLMTIAAYLEDPEGYAPDSALAAAKAALLGPSPSPETARALDTQMIEWGGFADERSYRPRDAVNPEDVATRLHDPAFVSLFTWTADRYPGRIAALESLPDVRFRDDLLTTMRRRLAIARALPLVIELLARRNAGRADAAAVMAKIADEQASWSGFPDARRVLDRFLAAADALPPKG